MRTLNGKLLAAVAGTVLAVAPSALAQVSTATVSGSISVAAPGGQPFVVPGVTITLTCGSGEPKVAVTDAGGAYQFAGVPAGTCSVLAELQGFKPAATSVTVQPPQPATADIELGLEAAHEEVTVSARAEASDENPIAEHVQRLEATQMQTAPTASERFQDALPLIPGVVRGPDGLLNINGARSNQSALRFNDANGTDPVTGEDAIELPIDAVSSVEVRGAAFAPEFGLSAGAVTTVETERAGDAWHVTVNDLEPRLRRRAGKFRGIESWTPRFTIGGPVVKGAVSLLESTQYQYSQTRVFDLPALESDTRRESFESYTRSDWSIGAQDHLTASALVAPRKTTYAGLTPFNPQSVTPDVQNHNSLGSVSNQLVIGGSGVLDTRVSVKLFDATISPSQGGDPMVLAPDVNAGSYFNDQDRSSRRTEWFTSYGFTPFGSAHLVKVGAGLTRERFDGVSTSRPVRIVRADGTLSRQIAFVGPGQLQADNVGVQGYAQDAWTASPRLSLEYGARFDRDSLTGAFNAAPRASFTSSLTNDGRTVVRGGAGMFYGSVPLNVASFGGLQHRVVTDFADDGVTVTGSPQVVSNVTPAALETPRSVNWTLELDREWLPRFYVRLGYQQRDSRHEPVLATGTTAGGAPAILLRTDGWSRYRAAEVTGRYQFHGDDQIVGSYARSSATGTLNDFNTYFGNVEDPIILADASGPLSSDAPNRFLFWSNVTLPHGFTVFPLLDVRTGFPLSVVDENRDFVGDRNRAGRYPTFLSLDMQVSKRLRVFGHDATIGIKVFNITDHFNPRDYQGNLASADFDRFENSVGRTFRGRWIFEF